MLMNHGQRLKLHDIFNMELTSIYIGLNIQSSKQTIFDISCFAVNEKNQLVDDRYFIFYNQITSPNQEIKMINQQFGDQQGFLVDLNRLPLKTCCRLIFVITIDGDDVMSSISNGNVRICTTDGKQFAEYKFFGYQFHQEKAIIACEIYFKNEWRCSAVGQGFNGGLSALLKSFGGEEIQEDSQPIVLKEKLSLEKQVAEKAPQLLNLVKKLTISLEKKKLSDLIAEVVLVLDASGSMTHQYNDGRVQMVIDRVIPLALQFDDNQTLDVWAYADKFKKLDSVTLNNVNNYIKNQQEKDHSNSKKGFLSQFLRPIFTDIGGANNEPEILRALIDEYNNRKYPVYVIFISDGGVSQNSRIKKLITEASKYGIFWQFIGLGGSGYGIFEQLDNLTGREIDNCDFFAIDDIRSFSDEKLYDLLLTEFPKWLEEAKRKNII